MYKICTCKSVHCSKDKICNCLEDKVCKTKLPTMEEIAYKLKTIYKQTVCSALTPAQQVVPDVSSGNSEELYVGSGNYMKEKFTCFSNSIDYCTANPDYGIAGVARRECTFDNSSISSPHHCNNLCCDHGAESFIKKESKPCLCRFVWCCKVECDVCIEKKTKYRCKNKN